MSICILILSEVIHEINLKHCKKKFLFYGYEVVRPSLTYCFSYRLEDFYMLINVYLLVLTVLFSFGNAYVPVQILTKRKIK